MSQASVKENDSLEALVGQVADEFLRRQEAGERPDAEEYIARHPEAAELLRKVLASLQVLDLSQPLADGGAPTPGVLGDFRIIREVGRGGMGIVYEAEQISLARRVALKVLPFAATLDPRHLQRFHNEARAAASLHHTNIVPVHFVGCERGVHFYAMQFIDGQSLAAMLQEQRMPAAADQPTATQAGPAAETAADAERPTVPAPRDAAYFRRVAEWGIQAAEALDHAHQMGIVHRDVKPANLLVDTTGRLWVTDFGLAQFQSDVRLTVTGDVVGTLRYMSPEQALARRAVVDHRADVYSLGATLYELLTLQPVFDGNDRQELLRQIAFEEPQRPTRLNPAIPADLQTIVLKALEKSPEDRYDPAQEVANELRRFLDHVPIQARRPSLLQVAAKWTRRHRGVVRAAIGLVIAAALALAISTWLIWRAHQETKQALDDAHRNEVVARNLQYASDMALAARLLQAGEVFRLSELLDRHIPAQEGDADYRGFEWWYLQQFRRPPPTAFRAHERLVDYLAYAFDGQSLVTGSYNHTADRVVSSWDVPVSTRRVHVAHEPDSTFTSGPGFATETRTLATITDHNTITIWDASTGTERWRLRTQHSLDTVALSPDGRLLATGGDGPITVWDVPARKLRHTYPDGSWRATRVQFSPNGRYLASNHVRSNAIQEWDLLDGTRHSNTPLRSPVGRFVYSPRGKYLVAILAGLPTLWNLLDTGDLIPDRSPLPAAAAGAVSMAVSPDERFLALGMGDGSLQIWDLIAREQVGLFRWQSLAITALAFAPNGRTVAAGTGDGMVYQFDTAVPRDPDALQPSLDAVGPAAISSDGRTLAVVAKDGGVRLLDTATRTIRRNLPRHLNRITRLVFAPDGRTLATVGDEESTIVLWDITSGQKVQTLVPADSHADGAHVTSLAFAPFGPMLAVGRYDGRVTLWNVKTGAALPCEHVHRNEVPAMKFSPDGRTLATADHAGIVRLWDVADVPPPNAHKNDLQLSWFARSLAFSQDGRMLVTGGSNGHVQQWRVEPTGPPVAVGNFAQPAGTDVEVSISADSRTLLSGDYNGILKLWDFATRRLRYQVNLAHGVGVNRPPAVLSPDGQTIYSVRGDGSVESWNLRKQTVHTPLNQGLAAVRSLAFTANGRSLLIGSAPPDEVIRRDAFFGPIESVPWREPGSTVRLWDVASRTEQHRLPGPNCMTPPELVAVAHDVPVVAAAGQDGSVLVWDRGAGKLRARLFVTSDAEQYIKVMNLGNQVLGARPQYPESIASLTLTADGQMLAAVSNRGTVTVWSWQSDGWHQRHSWNGPDSRWVGFAPDRSMLAVARGGQVVLHDPQTGRVQQTLGTPDDPAVQCAAFDPAGSRLAVGTADRAIRLWDLQTGESSARLIGHADCVTCLAFAPNGRTLASSSWDRTVRLWSVAGLQEVLTLKAHQGRVYGLAFSPDGKVLATGGETEAGMGEVYLWHADEAR